MVFTCLQELVSFNEMNIKFVKHASLVVYLLFNVLVGLTCVGMILFSSRMIRIR